MEMTLFISTSLKILQKTNGYHCCIIIGRNILVIYEGEFYNKNYTFTLFKTLELAKNKNISVNIESGSVKNIPSNYHYMITLKSYVSCPLIIIDRRTIVYGIPEFYRDTKNRLMLPFIFKFEADSLIISEILHLY